MRPRIPARFFACSLPPFVLALAGCAEGALIEHPASAWPRPCRGPRSRW